MGTNIEKTEFQITAIDNATRVFKSVQGAMGELNGSFVALTAALTGGVAMTAFVAKAVSARAALMEMSQTTGDSVQTLSGLAKVAKVSGVEMDQLGGALTKLAKNMNSADDDGKAAGVAIKSLGLNIEEVRAKKPGEAMLDIAIALNKFEDGAAKVAVAMALMGKSGASMLPYLKELGEQGTLNGKVTTEQAMAARELEKSWARLNGQMQETKNGIATLVIPVLGSLVDQMREGIKITGSLGAALLTLGTINPFRSIRGNIESLQADIDQRTANVANRQRMPSGFRGGAADADLLNKGDLERIAFLKYQQRQQALATSGEGSLDANDLRMRAKPQLDFVIPPKDRGGAGKDSGFDSLMDGLTKKLELDKQSSVLEKLNLDLARQKYSLITPAQREELRTTAMLVDVKLRDMEIRKAELDVALLEAAASKKAEDALQAEADARLAQQRAAKQTIDNLQFETSLIGLDTAARERAIAMRKLEADTVGLSADAIDHFRAALDKELTANATAHESDQRWQDYLKEQQDTAKQSVQIWHRAATEMEHSMSGFFFDVMQGNLKDFGTNIKSTLDKMVADTLAAEAKALLFGRTFSRGGSDQFGGYIGQAMNYLGWGGTSYSTLAATPFGGTLADVPYGATGGSWDVGGSGGTDSQLAQLHVTPGERVIVQTPEQQRATPSKSVTVVNQFTISGAVDNRSQAQIAAAAYEGVQRAAARNT